VINVYWPLLAVALLVAGFGAAIWRFEWIHLLNNVRKEEVDPAKKSDLARFGGQHLLGIGLILFLLGLLMSVVQAKTGVLIAIFLAVVGIFVTTGFYLKGLRRFLKK
jgi:hypothetical protein